MSKLIKDSIVQLSDIVIDKISIEPLLDKGIFFPQYPEPWLSQQKQIGESSSNHNTTIVELCITMANGKLNFTNPIHVWFFPKYKCAI